MRGPGLHLSPELRRLWRCPACGRERMVGQTETTVLCRCQDPPRFMQLVEAKRVVRPEPRPVARFYEEEELPPDEIDPNAPPLDPAIQSVPQKAPRPPRAPRPEGERPDSGGPGDRKRETTDRPRREGGRPGERRGGPPSDQKRPFGKPGERHSPRRERPAEAAAAPEATQVGENTPSSPPAGMVEGAADRPRKKRRRNRDRNREGGTTGGGQAAAPDGAAANGPSPAPPAADDFAAGLE